MPLNFAVLGTGHWAAQTHAVAIANHPRTNLVAVWGRRRESAEAIAAPFGARGYDDIDAALAGADAVAIALPPDIQASFAIQAARAGKHLLLDKPLALDVPTADQVVAAVAENDVANLVFFTNRFVPEVNRFLEELAARGEWDGARVAMLNSIFGADSPYRNSAWRRDQGGLWDLGPHALSLLVPVLGPVSSVVAAPGPHSVTHVILGHTSGAATTMSLGLAMPSAAVHQEFTFFGPAGTFPAPIAPTNPVDPVHSLRVAIDELVDQVEANRRDNPCDVRFARDVVAVLAAGQRARDEGVRVTL